MARASFIALDRRRATDAAVAAVLTVALGAGCYSGGNVAQDSDTAAASTTAGPGGPGGDEEDEPTGTGGDDESTGGEAPPMMEYAPGLPVLPRLTTRQYRNSVAALLGPGLPEPAIEPDTNPYLFFTIGASTTTLSELGAQQYEEAAEVLSRAVFDDPARREAALGCAPTAPGDACVSGFLTAFGRRAYRRPLTAEEQARWLAVSVDLSGGDPWRGVQLMVSGLLQSPHFLYRVELGDPDPNDATRRLYNDWEMASRMSFLIWNQTPDDLLLDAAAAGELSSDEGLLTHAQRLMDDPRARVAVQEFFAQFLDLGRLDGITRDPVNYPQYTPTIIESMRTEVQLLVDDFVYRRDADVRGIFSTRTTFVNTDLAALYGVPAEGATPITFVPVELPKDGPRAGLLTLGAFLTMNAHETATSPTARGKYVRERVLCQAVPPPPPDIDLNLEDNEGQGNTLREILEAHRTNPMCAGCHAFIDPPGFLFENFDSIGAWRTLDNGYPIDSSGDLDGKPLSDARGLADMLISDPRVGDCIVTQLFRHASGRLEDYRERPGIKDIQKAFAGADFRFRDLVLTMVVSEAFRTVAAEEISP